MGERGRVPLVMPYNADEGALQGDARGTLRGKRAKLLSKSSRQQLLAEAATPRHGAQLEVTPCRSTKL
jgi:hypothetical protein